MYIRLSATDKDFRVPARIFPPVFGPRVDKEFLHCESIPWKNIDKPFLSWETIPWKSPPHAIFLICNLENDRISLLETAFLMYNPSKIVENNCKMAVLSYLSFLNLEECGGEEF